MLPWNAALFSRLRDDTAMLRQFDTQVRLRKLFERSLLRLHVGKEGQTLVARGETLGLTLWKQASHIARPDDVAGREHNHPFHDIAEFPAISRPRIRHKDSHRLFIKMALRLVHGLKQPAEQMARDNGNVLATLAERGDGNRDDCEPIVQILPDALAPRDPGWSQR